MLARRYFEDGSGPQENCGTSYWEERSGWGLPKVEDPTSVGPWFSSRGFEGILGSELIENDLLGSGYFVVALGSLGRRGGAGGPGSSWAGGSGRRSRTYGGNQRAGEEESRGEVPGGVRGVGRPGGIGKRGAVPPRI